MEIATVTGRQIFLFEVFDAIGLRKPAKFVASSPNRFMRDDVTRSVCMLRYVLV
ncbi:hypothetical protein GGD46_003969 [Rhizobium lusitanum]|uniref:Uncharacterized protein n=1 Tax=Rhizobium lusitanum TaxID=293958 RepID=A0A7X0MF26_9HYPH|nr:hypothetical protein [Rhizobium lusitanum]